MPGPAKPLNVLAPQVEAERQRIRGRFDTGATARETLHGLCGLADNTIRQIFGDVMRIHETPNEGLALLALGGYGRKMLFPFSDLDILFLFENEKTEEEFGLSFLNFPAPCGTWDSASAALGERSMNASESKRTMRSFIWRFSIEDSFQWVQTSTKIVFPVERQAIPFAHCIADDRNGWLR